jgi:hypothetical protein
MPKKPADKPAAPSFLASLAVVQGPVSPGSKRKETAAEPCPGLTVYAALDKVKKEIEAILKGSPLKALVKAHFVTAGRAAKRTPTSYNTVDGDGKATANNQLVRKNESQNVDGDDVALCNDLGIDLFKKVIVPGAVIVNPKYMDETDALEKLGEMAKKAGFPADFFMLQNEVSKMVATDESLDNVFALGGNFSDERVGELLDLVAQAPRIVAKWHGSLDEALEIAQREIAKSDKAKGIKPGTPTLADVVAGAPSVDAAPVVGAKGDLMAAMKASIAAEKAGLTTADAPSPLSLTGGTAVRGTRRR